MTLLRLHPLKPLLAVFTGVVALGALQAPAEAATTRTLSISASPTSALVKKSVTVSGTLSKSPIGSSVVVQRKSGTKWVSVKSGKTTTTGGKYSMSVPVGTTAGTNSYRSYAAAKGSLKVAASKTISISALTPVVATIHAAPTTVNAGSSSTLSGTVKPFVKSTVVTIQKFDAGKWISAGVTTALTSTGTFSKAVPVTIATNFRVSVPRVGLKASAVSAGTTVTTNPVISTAVLPDADGALSTYSAQLTAVGNPDGTWSVTGLPAGLSANATTGAITQTAAITDGVYAVTIDFTATGNPTPATPVHLTLTVGSHAALIETGGQTSCRVGADQRLSCWGAKEAGQLGIGGVAGSDPFPQELKPVAVTGTGWTATTQSGGSLTNHSFGCGIRAATAYCWGDDTSGQLGDANINAHTSPGPVDGGAVWASISAGFESACAVRTTGALYCWGDNGGGQLGLGIAQGRTDKATPTRVGTDTDWKQVTIGFNGSCAVKTTGTLWCWGFNFRGQLGTGNKDDQTSPTQVGNDNDWANVSNGNGFTCAVKKTAGTLWCWGPASNGELGNGVDSSLESADQTSPVQVGLATNWAGVSAGDSHACATTTSGEVWCWGANSVGQVGDNTNASRSVPTRVGSDSDWGSVSAGGNHSCAMKTSGDAWCWGSNNKGELGINNGPGSIPSSNFPRPVVN